MASKENPSSIPKFHAMAWAHAVRQATGMNDTAIEKRFMGPDCCRIIDKRLKTPRLFTKYINGESAPTHKGSKCGGMDFVDRIEVEYPNTKLWLSYPLWQLLYMDNLTLPEIWEIMLKCNIKNPEEFFIPTASNGLVRTGLVTRKKLLTLEKSESALVALTFLIGLIREAEIRLVVQIHRMSVSRIIALLPRLCEEPVIKEFAGTLFDYLEIKFFRVSYGLPDNGVEMIFSKSWRDIYLQTSKSVNGSIVSKNVPSSYRSLFHAL
jgi:hypothetical protein